MVYETDSYPGYKLYVTHGMIIFLNKNLQFTGFVYLLARSKP